MFGNRLKKLREAKGWSQKQLADAAGLSQKGVSHWENNERTPAWDAVLKLCKALGVTCEAFGDLDDLEAAAEEPPAEKAGRGRPPKAPAAPKVAKGKAKKPK